MPTRSDSHHDTTNLRVSAKPARSRHFRICGDARADCDACRGNGPPRGCKCEECSFQGGKCDTTPFGQRLGSTLVHRPPVNLPRSRHALQTPPASPRTRFHPSPWPVALATLPANPSCLSVSSVPVPDFFGPLGCKALTVCGSSSQRTTALHVELLAIGADAVAAPLASGPHVHRGFNDVIQARLPSPFGELAGDH
jgi:hypothetical protein